MFVKSLTLNETGFPGVLRHISQPPRTLYYVGTIEPLTEVKKLAVVGSRKITDYGRYTTETLVRESVRQEVAIISGLALGVDGVAHRAALDAGGYTVAIMPCGLDRIYPASHATLAHRIVEQGGALISEYPEGTEPYKHNFIARNRIVSGLADGVLITEAGERSGTIHTANFALEQGKTVMAVPGNITSPSSIGTNNLIKAGAIPVTSSKDICMALGIDITDTQKLRLTSNAEEALIIRHMETGITDAITLLQLSELSASLFNQTLTMLELNGLIRPIGAGHYILC